MPSSRKMPVRAAPLDQAGREVARAGQAEPHLAAEEVARVAAWEVAVEPGPLALVPTGESVGKEANRAVLVGPRPAVQVAA